MVRNKLCWDANNAVGLSKQRKKVELDWYEFLCFGSPTALFVPWSQRFFFIFHCMRAAREPRSGEREYKTSRPNTTPTVRGICTFAVCFSVFRPFKFCEGHFALCYKEKTRAVRSCYGKYLRVVSLSLTPL